MNAKEQSRIEKIQQLSDEGDFQLIINLIDTIPEEEVTPLLISEKARAYNNLYWDDPTIENEKYLEKAVELLLSVEDVLKEDPKWNFRIGYSYFHLENVEKAKFYFEKSNSLEEDETAQDFIKIIQLAEEKEIPMSEAELVYYASDEDFEPYYYEPEEIEELESYINTNFGKIENVFHELISPDIHCDVYVVEPTEERNYYTLITGGMGAYPMNVPKEAACSPHAELMIHLPADWNIHSEEEKDYWPIRWLKNLARLPIDQDTFLGWGHSIPVSEGLEGTDFTGFLLITADDAEGNDSVAELSSGKDVVFYQIIPIYEEEMIYKLEHSVADLFSIFQEKELPYPPVVDVNRPNACLGYQALENPSLLDDVLWVFNDDIYSGLMPFYEDVKALNRKYENDIEDFTPFATIYKSPKVKVVYEASIQSAEDLYNFETLTDPNIFEKNPNQEQYDVTIVMEIESSQDHTFPALELLWIVHNTLANKNLKEKIIFDGFDFLTKEEDGTPVLYLMKRD